MNFAIGSTLLIILLFLATNPFIGTAFATHSSSEADYVAIYLGPTYLTSAHCPRGEKPVKIAQTRANQGWQNWALKRSLAVPGQPVNRRGESEYDSDLLTMFLPTLQQIAQATTAKLQRPYELYFIVLSHSSGMTGRNTMIDPIRNSTDPNSEYFAKPPLPLIDIYDRSPFIRVDPMSLMAYNLTTPESWGARPNHLQNMPDLQPGDRFKDDDDFALLVNFEPKYLELAFECSDWACDPPVRALHTNLGEETLFKGAINWNVTSEEWNEIIDALSREMFGFVRKIPPLHDMGNFGSSLSSVVSL